MSPAMLLPFGRYWRMRPFTGLRGEELLGLTKDAVDFARDLLFVAKPKAKKDPRRTQGVPMSSEVRETLLRLSRESPSRYLFVRPGTGGRVSLSMFDHRLEEACARIGVEGVHPHTLRHTFGTRLGDADVDVKKIQRLMGTHKSATRRGIPLCARRL